MITDQMIRAAAAASLLTLACTSGDVVQVDTTATTGPPPAESESGTDPQGPESEPPHLPVDGEAPCQLDADCSAGTFCELRICVAGCEDAAGCDAGQVCDPHGRCQTEAGDTTALRFAGAPTLTKRRTVLALGETRARTVLRNDGTEALTYRLAAANPALTVDTAPAKLAPGAPAKLAPGAEVELIADVDLAALTPADHVLPVQIITSGAAILWSLAIEGQPEVGNFRGAVSFGAAGFSLASTCGSWCPPARRRCACQS